MSSASFCDYCHVLYWVIIGKFPYVPVSFTYFVTVVTSYIEKQQVNFRMSQYALFMTMRHVVH